MHKCVRACVCVRVQFSLLKTTIFFQILRLEKAFKTSNNAEGEADFRSSWTLDKLEMHGFHRTALGLCVRVHITPDGLPLRCDNTSIPDTWSWSQTALTQRTSILLSQHSNPQTFRQTKMDTPLLLGLIIIELQIIHLLVRNGSGFICDCKKWKTSPSTE